MSKANEGAPAGKRPLMVSEHIEAGARHALSALGGGVTAVLTYVGAEALFKTMGFVNQANEAGFFSAPSVSAGLELATAGACALAAVRVGSWSVKMHTIAEEIESGEGGYFDQPKRKH